MCTCDICKEFNKIDLARIQARNAPRDSKGRFTSSVKQNNYSTVNNIFKLNKHQFVKQSSKPSEHRELLRNHENRIRALELIVQKQEK